MAYSPKTNEDFLKWRNQYPSGFIISKGSNGAMLHKANCFHLTWNERATGLERLDIDWVKNEKWCSLDRHELVQKYGPGLKHCSHCLK